MSTGNSRGVRPPKAPIEEVGLVDEVEGRVRDGVLITPLHTPRAGWAEAAQRLAAEDDQGLLLGHVATRFEDDEWQW